MKQPTCIYCDSGRVSFVRKEHIIPESLGGDEVVQGRLVCDSCNQVSWEQRGLGSLAQAPKGLAGLGVLTRSRATPVPNGPTLSGRRLWGTLLSSNPNSLEWTQIDRPRVPQVCVSIVSVE